MWISEKYAAKIAMIIHAVRQQVLAPQQKRRYAKHRQAQVVAVGLNAGHVGPLVGNQSWERVLGVLLGFLADPPGHVLVPQPHVHELLRHECRKLQRWFRTRPVAIHCLHLLHTSVLVATSVASGPAGSEDPLLCVLMPSRCRVDRGRAPTATSRSRRCSGRPCGCRPACRTLLALYGCGMAVMSLLPDHKLPPPLELTRMKPPLPVSCFVTK